MRYYLHLAYQGKNYRGWQRQPNVISVQEIVEDSIGKILKNKTVCIGCGRTDAGVHASQYILHFDVKEVLKNNFIEQLNLVLPSDIVAYEIKLIQGNPHAQFDATLRTYDYFFHIKKTLFINEFSSFYYVDEFDINKINKAIELIKRNKDFYHFCKTPDKHNNTFCEIESCHLSHNENKTHFHFQIKANRFLRGMIRIIMDRLIRVGQGNLSLEKFHAFLKREEKPQFINYAHPQGLFLSRIEYPFINFEPKSDFSFVLRDGK